MIKRLLTLAVIVMMALGGPATANAIFSSEIAADVVQAKQNLLRARQQNGRGDLRQAWRQLMESREVAEGETKKSVGVCGIFAENRQVIADQIYQDGLDGAVNTFVVLFNYENACVRDDILELQSLKAAISEAMLRASMLCDTQNAEILRGDYERINAGIAKIRNPELATTLNFPAGSPNVYIGNSCPYGELNEAVRDFGRSWDAFSDSITNIGSTATWPKSIFNQAAARATTRAQNWIRQNQLQLTLGGERGGNARSLIKDPALFGISRWFETQLEVAKALVQPLALLKRDENSVSITEFIDRQQRQIEALASSEKQVEQAVKYQLQFVNLGEESLKDIDGTLSLINTKIEEGYKNLAPEAVNWATLKENFEYLRTNHCANRQ